MMLKISIGCVLFIIVILSFINMIDAYGRNEEILKGALCINFILTMIISFSFVIYMAFN